MKRILILAILLMLLAAPVLARPHGSPDYNSEGSTAYFPYDAGYYYCGWATGYQEIGICVSSNGGHQNGGISWAAHNYRGP